MRIILILSLLLIVVNCSSGKQVYWCGDHPCANKKEREAYFKKTMTVEIKEMGKKKKSDKSKLAKILEQAEIDQNKNVKNDKDLAKQQRLEEKEKIKEQKAMMKQAKIEQKKRAKEENLSADVYGPLAFDNAVSLKAAKIKNINNIVAGNADIILVPNLETGNSLVKMMIYFIGACAAGIIV